MDKWYKQNHTINQVMTHSYKQIHKMSCNVSAYLYKNNKRSNRSLRNKLLYIWVFIKTKQNNNDNNNESWSELWTSLKHMINLTFTIKDESFLWYELSNALENMIG